MTKTQPTHKKLPRGCIKKLLHEHYWMAVIPAHTPAQAKQIVKAAEFLRLSYTEKMVVIGKIIRGEGNSDERAAEILAAMGMGGASK